MFFLIFRPFGAICATVREEFPGYPHYGSKPKWLDYFILWFDDIVPFSMELLPCEIERGEFFIGDFDPCLIDRLVNRGLNIEARVGGGVGEEIDDGGQTVQGSPAPIFAAKGKPPMFNFVPFARAGRKVTHPDGQL